MSRCRDAVMAGSGFIMVVLGMLNFATQMKTMTTAEALRYSVKLTLGAMVMFYGLAGFCRYPSQSATGCLSGDEEIKTQMSNMV